jgi:hypothetical protein
MNRLVPLTAIAPIAVAAEKQAAWKDLTLPVQETARDRTRTPQAGIPLTQTGHQIVPLTAIAMIAVAAGKQAAWKDPPLPVQETARDRTKDAASRYPLDSAGHQILW